MARLPVRDLDVVSARSAKNRLDPWKPYLSLVEPELAANGRVEDVLTIFLTNQECPFRCTMCDLWRNTLDQQVPKGAIPAQIDHACQLFPGARHVKLYNAGNFFDAQAIPPGDHAAIASRVHAFETVIIENHPRLTDERCLRFRDAIDTRLEVALGLETIHPTALANLNKRMDVHDFDRAARFLVDHDVAIRTFLLVKPPGLDAAEAAEWSLRSLKHAIQLGASCISLIPVRGGNGIMEQLQAAGEFTPPTIRCLEQAFDLGMQYVRQSNSSARVFVDLWDIDRIFDCPDCGSQRAERLQRMNFSQKQEPPITCAACEQNPRLS